MKKTKIYLFPNFYFEAIVSAFLADERYELLLTDELPRTTGDLVGDYCFPLQYLRDLAAGAVAEGAEIIIGARAEVCAYPLAMRELIFAFKKTKFALAPMNALALTPLTPWHYWRALRPVLPELTAGYFLRRLPLAGAKLLAAEKIQRDYLRLLPRVADPYAWQARKNAWRRCLLTTNSLKLVRSLPVEFVDGVVLKENFVPWRVVLTGDFSVLLLQFLLLDLEMYLAVRGIEVVQPFSALSSFSLRYFSAGKKRGRDWLRAARGRLRSGGDAHYLIEKMTLAQVARGLAQDPAGLIFVRPVMCSPCLNLSRIFENSGAVLPPRLELTYDGQSGLAGIHTRLEAFINLMSENHERH